MALASSRPSCVARVGPASCLALLLALGGSCLADSPRDDPDARYLTGLRTRQLFSLAERYCLQRLADPQLPRADRVRLAIELSRCFAEHATWRTGREQDELWQRAESVVAEQLSGESDPARRSPLVLQAASVAASHGTWLRWRSELSPYNDALRKEAIAHLHASRETQMQAEATIAGLDRDVAPAAGSDVRKLSAEARFQTAVTCLDLARLLPTGIERTSALHDADVRLSELSRSPFFESRRTAAKLLWATTARLRDDYDGALRQLDALATDDLPVSVRQQAVAESMRVELDRGKPEAALLQLAEIEQSVGGLSDELACVEIEARLAARQQSLQAGDTARAATLLEQAVAAASRVQGPWRARCSAVLQQSRSFDEYGSEVAPLILAARAAQEDGDTDAAIARYRESTQAARRAARDELASELQFTTASLLLHAERYEEAGEEFKTVADAVKSASAADAHLLWAYCRGKQWEARPTQVHREAYAAALNEHLQRFKESPTQTEAIWMLAAYQESRLQWTEALTLYESIPTAHTRAPAARVRIAVLYEQILDRLRQSGQPRDEWEHRAVARIEELARQLPQSPALLTIQDATAALGFARLLLESNREEASSCDALLTRVIDDAKEQTSATNEAAMDQSAEWQRLVQSAEQLRLVSFAGQGRMQEARRLLGSLTAADPDAVLGVVDGLSEAAFSASADRRAVLGELQLEAVAEVESRRPTLSAEQQQRLDTCLAQAFAAVGRPNDAARAYRRLLEKTPDDRRLLAQAALGIAGLGTQDAIRESKGLWRRVEALETPGSRNWLTARLEVARCCQQLGEVEECRKLLGVTRLLYPELGGPELKAGFEELDAASNPERSFEDR